ncbi:MAG TPA: filamentous hemagglutinin N-terminal domain-containing protein, partial [Stellaceae bacterium]|nr:filamentous hemagglutinin N-terminal domain-containing protein [Stellaceae bacterium]
MASRPLRHWRKLLLASTCLGPALAAEPVVAQTRPAGLSVVAGQATLTAPNAQTTIITQSTGKAILEWSNFSIGKGASVVFRQPDSGSIALNRVRGSQASLIDGALSANGQIWIVNANGVVFGGGAQVNVAGLIATTSDIADGDFLGGHYNFSRPSANANASIVNNGKISIVPGGSAVLVGAHVDNRGLIEADLGTVAIGGAKTFAVDLTGDKLLRFQVSTPVDQTPLGSDGKAVDALVSNSGVIKAEGGKVLITARAAKGIIDQVINTSGVVEARTAHLVNGEIVLDGGDAGAVEVSGGLDASGRGQGQTGGRVSVLGNDVGLFGSARIDASGDAGGGTVLIGGNAHGAGPEPNAVATVMAQGATISADALTSGNGGKVVLWSQGFTNFAGAISARGGASGGDGGFVETSSGGNLQAFGSVTASAPHGRAGAWLLDPEEVTIGTSDVNVTNVGNVFSPTGENATIAAATIDASLNAGTSVSVTTGSRGGDPGDITVTSAITKTSGGAATLSLTAGANGGIDIEAPISSTSGALGLTLQTGARPITLNADLTTAGGAVMMNGPVIVPSSVRIDTTSGGVLAAGANVTFTGSIDGSGNAGGALTIAGNSSFDGLVGSRTAL